MTKPNKSKKTLRKYWENFFRNYAPFYIQWVGIFTEITVLDKTVISKLMIVIHFMDKELVVIFMNYGDHFDLPISVALLLNQKLKYFCVRFQHLKHLFSRTTSHQNVEAWHQNTFANCYLLVDFFARVVRLKLVLEVVVDLLLVP